MMLFPLALILLFVLILREKPFIHWEVCHDDDVKGEYVLHDLKMDLNPEEPHRGKPIIGNLQAVLEDDVTEGAYTVEYKLSYGLLVIRTRKVDVCLALEEAAKWITGVPVCPIPKGRKELVLSGKVPIETPMGKYALNLLAYRNNDTRPLICINAQAYLGLT